MAGKQKAEIKYTRFFNNELPPGFRESDLVIVMGRPMSANDEDALPWLVPEKAFIRGVIENGISTVAICLGAQLIASALGARVYQNSCKEIGWLPVTATSPARNAFHFPKSFMAFH